MPSKLTDPHHLRRHAYRDDARLNARIALNERFSTNPQPWHAWVFDQLDIPPQAHILEVGCGPGELWHENQKRIHPNTSIILTDLSPGMLKEARSKLGSPQFAYSIGNAQSIPFPIASFDLVIANHMLYYLPDRERAYQAFSRVLRPGGVLYAATNSTDHLKELVDLIHGFDAQIEYAGIDLGFNLENGHAELTPWFKDIELRRYPDSLEVTEAQPLAAYIASMSSFTEETFTGDRLNDLAHHLQSIIDQHGSIHITKSVGLFIAHKT